MFIPDKFHFIYLNEGAGAKPFSLVHYVSIKSAIEVNNPDSVTLYYSKEPDSFWWDKIKGQVNLEKVVPPNSVFGRPITHVAHKADVLRLEKLIKHGGIYLDIDIVCLKPFKDLLNNKVVLGREKKQQICNGVIMAKKNSAFLKEWYQLYRSFDDTQWSTHSGYLSTRLAQFNPSVRLEPPESFFIPSYRRLPALFKRNQNFPQAYCYHLWEKLSWNFIKQLTVSKIRKEDTTFNVVARKYLSDIVIPPSEDKSKHKHKVIWRKYPIFIHTPKTAGTSMAKILKNNKIRHFWHKPAKELLRGNPFSFAFVRNPYDRFVSAYQFVKDGIVDPVQNKSVFKIIKKCGDFETFCMDFKNYPVCTNHVIFEPQYKFLCDKEKIIVDFIGRYENLHEDWFKLLKKLKIKDTPLPMLRKSKRTSDYMSYYTEDAKQAIGEYYKKDFEIFGY